MEFTSLIMVTIGGGAGALLRSLINESAFSWSRGLPAGTLLCNLLGSAAIGWFVAHTAEFSPSMRALIMPGLLGGLTTMSSFALEMATMVHERRWSFAGTYGAITILGCVTLALIAWRMNVPR